MIEHLQTIINWTAEYVVKPMNSIGLFDILVPITILLNFVIALLKIVYWVIGQIKKDLLYIPVALMEIYT